MKKLAVTMGDPAGVGPEICLRLLADPSQWGAAEPLVYGDLVVLDLAAETMGLPKADPKWVNELGLIGRDDFPQCKVSAAAGKAAYGYIIQAIDDALAGKVAGVCTGPINKEALHAAGINYPGHTEIFADKMNAERSCMLQVSDAVTASFVTCHCGYDEVPSLMTRERILEVIEMTAEAIERIRDKKPLLVCCGLNPHAGEHGLFGNNEEERIIVPALEEARRRGITIEGPLPPDTVFIPKNRERFDGVICMYHDQGHIPLKALAFDSAVNTTLGLPLVRTSVDHGTAFDIAWKGEADPGSLFEAFQLGGRLAE